MSPRVGMGTWGRKETFLSLSAIERRCPDFPAPNLFDIHTKLSRLTDSLA